MSDEISPAFSIFFFDNFQWAWTTMMQFSKREIEDKENKNGDNPVQTYISTEEHGSVFREQGGCPCDLQ